MSYDAPRRNRRSPDVWLAALLLVATLVAYAPALRGEFLLDDDLHVTRPDLRALGGLARIWGDIGATQQYYPVLHTAFWIEHRLWGDAVLGYHLINVLMHVTAACLVVVLMRRLHLRGGWLAAFVFALHPVAVESVAWMAEQKNTLSTVFALAAALLYLKFDDTRSGRQYAFASALFVFALLSKTATATLPAALAVIGWWLRGRFDWKRDALPLLPWFGLAALLGAITVAMERELLAGIAAQLPLTPGGRMLVAGRALWFYLAELVWPADLAFFYERWPIAPGDATQWLFPLGVVAVATGLIWRARRHRGALAAFLIFALTLAPVLGFVNVEWFVFAFVADHFQYVASLAVIVPVAAGFSQLIGEGPAGIRRFAMTAAVAALGGLGALSWRQSATFHDSVALYARAVARSPGSAVAHNHLGVALAQTPGRLHEAVREFDAALRINPAAAETHENLGAVLLRQPGGSDAALVHLEAALQLKPGLTRARTLLAGARFERGQLAAQRGDIAGAITEYELALHAHPRLAEAHYNLGNAFLKTPGREPDAVAHFEAAVRLKPNFAEAHTNLGAILARQPDRLDEAIAHFEAALRANPEFAPARNNLRQARALREEFSAGRRSANADPSR